MAVGLVAATGGMAVGGMAAGGGAVGVLASGGGAAGIYAQGGDAFDAYTRDALTPRGPGAVDPLAGLTWFFGPWPPDASSSYVPMLVVLGLSVLAGLAIAIPALVRHRSAGSMQTFARPPTGLLKRRNRKRRRSLVRGTMGFSSAVP